MNKKRKILFYTLILGIVLLSTFIIYYIGSSVLNYLNATKNSKKIVLEFNEIYENDSTNLILFASPTCQFCKKFVVVLDELKKENQIDYYYLNISNLTENDLNKITDKIGIAIEGVPHFIILKNQKLIAELSGFNEKEIVIQFLKDNNVIKGD